MRQWMCPWTKCIGAWCCAAALLAADTPAQAPPVTLTLSQAVDLALKNNLQALLAEERVTEARGEKAVALSALLPNLSGVAYESNLTSNLTAMGLSAEIFPGIPAFIGPFNRFDARVQFSQTVFSLASIRRYQAGNRAVTLAGHHRQLAAQQIAAATSLAYLAVLESGESVAAAQANLELARRLLDLAKSRREEGVATGIDVARAETRLANQQVQLAQTQTNLDSARLGLLRIVGAPLSCQLALTQEMRFSPQPPPDRALAVDQALAGRVELKAARESLRIAELQRKAAVADWAPSASFFGDYGSSGLKVNAVNLPTRSIGVRLDVPLFNGGRTRAETQIASSRQRQAEMQLNDLRAAVEKDVRQALDNLATREEQVKAAQKAVALAERELELAQDRFRNGVADNIEVVNAQTAVENARQALVSSVAQFNVARLSLAVASGHAEDFRL